MDKTGTETESVKKFTWGVGVRLLSGVGVLKEGSVRRPFSPTFRHSLTTSVDEPSETQSWKFSSHHRPLVRRDGVVEVYIGTGFSSFGGVR